MRLIGLVLFMALSVLSYAQTFSADAESVSSSGNHDQHVFYNFINLNNLTDSSLTLRWVETATSVPAAWDTRVQAIDLFSPIGTDSADFILPDTSAVGNYLLVHFFPNSQRGNGYVNLKVYDINYPAYQVFLTYTGEAKNPLSTSIVSSSTTKTVLYPNPTSGQGALLMEVVSGDNMESLAIINAQGRRMSSSFTQQGNLVVVDVSQLPAGTFYLFGRTEMGELLQSTIVVSN